MREGTVAIARQSGAFVASFWPVLATLLWGGVLIALLSGFMVKLVRKFIGRFGLPLVADFARHGRDEKSALRGT